MESAKAEKSFKYLIQNYSKYHVNCQRTSLRQLERLTGIGKLQNLASTFDGDTRFDVKL